MDKTKDLIKEIKNTLEIYEFNDPFDYERAAILVTEKFNIRLEQQVIPIYKPIGSLVLNRIYCDIDNLLSELGIVHDESYAQMIVNAIEKDKNIRICVNSA